MEFKLLVDDILEQRVIKVGISGSYFDESKVLWDERVDGNLPKLDFLKLGGYERSGDELVFNQSKQDLDKERKRSAKNKRDNIKFQNQISKILKQCVKEKLDSGMSKEEIEQKLKVFFDSALG